MTIYKFCLERQNGISDSEKSAIITSFLKDVYLPMLKMKEKEFVYWKPWHNHQNLTFIVGYNYLYKYAALFDGDKEYKDIEFTYANRHSMLANLVIDFPPIEGDLDIVVYLRKSLLDIQDFSKDESENVISIKYPKGAYSRVFMEMFRHILVSYNELPRNININSIRKSGKSKELLLFKNQLPL